MVQQPTSSNHPSTSSSTTTTPTSHDLSADFDHRVVRFPTRSAPRFAPYVPPQVTKVTKVTDVSQVQGQSAVRQVVQPRVRVRKNAIRQVVVLDASGRLSDVVEDLDRAIQLALADEPRGLVCDLSDLSDGSDRSDLADRSDLSEQSRSVMEGAEHVAVEVLATAGRHVRDWPGIPVAVACPDPRVREALRAHPLGEHLIVTESMFSAITAVLLTPTLAIERLHLAPHPTAPRAAREFVTRTLLDWQLSRVIPFASLVISELVASSSVNAGTDIDLSVVWDRGALRLTVRDHGPAMASQQRSALDLHGRRLTVVAGLSRTFGVLPTADGGKVVWAVLEAPRPRPSTSPHRSAAARQESLILSDARALAELPLSAGHRRPPADPVPARRGGDPTSAGRDTR